MVNTKRFVKETVIDMALNRMNDVFDKFETVAVSFSGGKDSTAVLNIALQVAKERRRLPLDVMFWDEEAIPPETVEYCDRVRKTQPVNFQWLCIPTRERNASSRRHPWWFPWAPEDKALWCRPLPEGAITELQGFRRFAIKPGQKLPHGKGDGSKMSANGLVYPPARGQVCVVLGLRSQESISRYRAIAAKSGFLAFYAPDDWRHVTRASPIYDWHATDVWLAPEIFGWDYNRAYDKMQAAGIPLNAQRCAPPWGEEPLGKLNTFPILWPDLWAKMLKRVPGCATAGRYCATPLYGYDDRKDLTGGKRADQRWQDIVIARMQKFGPSERPLVANSIRQCMQLHRKSTNRPMPDDKKDPDSGMSWRQIAMIALRGDFRGRRKGHLSTHRKLKGPKRGKAAPAKKKTKAGKATKA